MIDFSSVPDAQTINKKTLIASGFVFVWSLTKINNKMGHRKKTSFYFKKFQVWYIFNKSKDLQVISVLDFLCNWWVR